MAEHHFNIDSTQVNPTIQDSPAIAGSAEFDDCNETAHLISNDAWYQAGFVLVTSLNSVFALGYSGIIMVPLGWIGGTIGLVTMACISLYTNHLLARLHEIGGKRHIRYRDLAGHIYVIGRLGAHSFLRVMRLRHETRCGTTRARHYMRTSNSMFYMARWSMANDGRANRMVGVHIVEDALVGSVWRGCPWGDLHTKEGYKLCDETWHLGTKQVALQPTS